MKKLVICILLGLGFQVNGQKIEFTNPDWTIKAKGHELGLKDGFQSLKLVDGVATLEKVDFVNGLVEFDMLFSNEMSFPGLMFRMQDGKNYEEFYIRPWLSGNPDASQYSPVHNGFSGWQLYYGKAYAKSVDFNFNQWVHFKFVVRDDIMDIYIGDNESPQYTVRLKRRIQSGYLGIKNGFAPVYFANFKVVKNDDFKIFGQPKQEKNAEEGTVMQWEISKPFFESSLEGSNELPNSFKFNSFENVESEETGILNIAKYSKRDPGQDSAYLKLNMVSSEDQIVPFQFGFSDRIRVYLNGKLLFYANDAWRTRDYKFLGTIGLHDMLYLPLTKGNNELVLAVSESFGGWGAMGRFPDTSKITF